MMFSLHYYSVFCFVISQLFPHLILSKEDYKESLAIAPLPGNYIASTLLFEISRQPSTTNDHFVVFPRVIDQLMSRYGLDELSFRLTQGRWRYDLWGYPSSPLPGGAGAHVVAWFAPQNDRDINQNDTNVDNNWHDLIHSLSGLFCASLESIDKTLTVVPEWLWDRPRSGISASLGKNPAQKSAVRYGSLPSESLCTENITPWKKLLPCKADAGLASMLHPTVILGSHFLSIGVNVKKIMSDTGGPPAWELALYAHMVSAHPSMGNSGGRFSVGDIFLTRTPKICPLAKKTVLSFEMDRNLSHNESLTALPVKQNETLDVGRGVRRWAVYELADNRHFVDVVNMKINFAKPTVQGMAPLGLHCFLSGSGQHHGSILCHISHRINASTPIVYAHLIPWYLRVYFHSLNVACRSWSIAAGDGRIVNPVRYANFQPGKFRQKPHFYEFHATLPPLSTCTVSLRVEKLLLRWTEYPPDANHGFWIPSPVIKTGIPHDIAILRAVTPWATSLDNITTSTSSADGSVVKVRMLLWGEIMLANLPTPDFSMPYNVICLVCTVVALAFGPIHNLTTKSMVLKDPKELEEKGLRRKFSKAKEALKAKLLQKFGKKPVTTDKPDEDNHDKND